VVERDATTNHQCGYCTRSSVKSILDHSFHIHQAAFDCSSILDSLGNRQAQSKHSLNSQMVAGEDRLVITPINPRPPRLSHSIGSP
jgi:hypothetical protein